MELLERYIEALHAELPAAQAAEICREVKANILEELGSVPVAEQAAQLEVILLHYGEPRQLALRYAPAEPLIAASDMRLFWELNTVMLAIVVTVQGLALLLKWLTAAEIRPIQGLIQYSFATAHMAAIGFAIITLVFYFSKSTAASASASWQPTDLPAVRFSWQRIKRISLIQEMATILFAVTLLWPGLWLADVTVLDTIWFVPELQPWRVAMLLWCALALEVNFWWLFKPIWSKTKLKLNLLLNLSLLMLLGWGALQPVWLNDAVVALISNEPDAVSWAYWTRQSFLLVVALVACYEISRDSLRLRKLA